MIAEAGRNNCKAVLWSCLCDCGNEHITTGGNITSGHTKSCGHCYSNCYRISDDGSYVIGTFPNGKEFLFDIEDFEKVKTHTWSLAGRGYVIACIAGVYTLQHRFLMNAQAEKKIDHINLSKCDNRKSNLRFASHKENARNTGLSKNNTSGIKGVYYHKKNHNYVARIKVDGRDIHLGCFPARIEAALAYNNAAIKYFGEFAWLNPIERDFTRNVQNLSSTNVKHWDGFGKPDPQERMLVGK